jgi:excisionase family DNA binding protein
MPEAMKNLAEITVTEAAELFGVESRTVRKWVTEKGLPIKGSGKRRFFDWHEALAWYVKYRLEEIGTIGTGTARNGPDSPETPEETYDDALARKTRAEADLKELQLARERSEVAAIGDVERALSSANKATQTLILAFPSRLATQLLGLDDRSKINAVLQRECNSLLGNLATIDTVLKDRDADEDEDE